MFVVACCIVQSAIEFWINVFFPGTFSFLFLFDIQTYLFVCLFVSRTTYLMCYPYIVFGSVCGFQVTIERERNSLGFGEWGWIEGIVFLLVRHITHI